MKPKWLNNILERKIRAVDGRSYSVDARTPRDFMRILNEGRLFCLLADQDSRIPSALSGTLLGQSVNVNPLPDFLLKHRPQTPVFICWMEERDASSKGASPKGAIPKKVRVLHAIEVGGAQSKIASSTDSGVVDSQFNKWLEVSTSGSKCVSTKIRISGTASRTADSIAKRRKFTANSDLRRISL